MRKHSPEGRQVYRMVNVKIGDDSGKVVRSALDAYAKDVGEMVAYIQRSSLAAGFPDDRYLPEDLTTELESIETCYRILHTFAEDHVAKLMGRSVATRELQVMHSALALYREELASHLAEVRLDRLAPPEAVAPFEDRLTSMDEEIERFWKQFGTSPYLPEVRARRLLKSGLHYPDEISIDAALERGEGQTIEFKREFPRQATDLAAEIAAFGSTNPGTIFLGISDEGAVVGLQGCESATGQDELRKRIEGITSNSVVPSLLVKVSFEEYQGQMIARISVPRGPQPIYYSRNIPYVRHLSSSRPAQPQEVLDAVRKHAEEAGKP